MPPARTDEQLRQAIRANVAVHERGCWLWQRALGADGYGRTCVRGKVVLAHRASYELFVGPIPEGLQVDHLCAIKACVNPEHLEPVTPKVNTQRALPWTNGQARRSSCPKGHAYTEENTRIDARGHRHCRACDAAVTAAVAARRRQERIDRFGFDPGPRSRRHLAA